MKKFNLILISLLLLLLKANGQSDNYKIYSQILDTINDKYRGEKFITTTKQKKVDPTTISDDDFITVPITIKQNYHFMIVNGQWPIYKEEFASWLNDEPVNKFKIFKNSSTDCFCFKGSYLSQHIDTKMIDVECSFYSRIYKNGKTDTTVYTPMYIQFSEIAHYRKKIALVFAIFRYANGGGSKRYMFLFKRKKKEWYIDKMELAEFDRW